MVANENETIVVETEGVKPWSEHTKELKEAGNRNKEIKFQEIKQEIFKAIVLSILVAAASLGVLSLSVHYSSIVLENVRTIGVVGFMDSVSIASAVLLFSWALYSVFLMMRWLKGEM